MSLLVRSALKPDLLLPCVVQLSFYEVVLLVNSAKTASHRPSTEPSQELVALQRDVIGTQTIRLVTHDRNPLNVVLSHYFGLQFGRRNVLKRACSLAYAVVAGTVQAVTKSCGTFAVSVNFLAYEALFKVFDRFYVVWVVLP
jgi:hypothetical protein